MGNNKRYFWLKLFDDFFTSKRIKRLRQLAGGDTYTIIYLKMQLKALKDNGYLYFDGLMGEFAEELALDIDEKPDDVKMTIQYLLSVGLIECSDSGEEWYLTYMKNCIGSETASTQRSRKSREKQNEEKALQCNADATQVQQNCIGDIEKDLDKELDIDKKKNTKKKKVFVPPTEEEVDAYCKERGNGISGAEFVASYESKGWLVGKNKTPMKDWKAAVRTWEINRNFHYVPPKDKPDVPPKYADYE